MAVWKSLSVATMMIFLELDKLSKVPGWYDISVAYEIFPHIAKGAMDREGEDLDIIIGMDHADLMPYGDDVADIVDRLRVYTVPFSGGRRVLAGRHPQIKFENPVLADHVHSLNHATFAPAPTRSGAGA